MIDIAQHEARFARVLGFLDEQLGAADITIKRKKSIGERREKSFNTIICK